LKGDRFSLLESKVKTERQIGNHTVNSDTAKGWSKTIFSLPSGERSLNKLLLSNGPGVENPETIPAKAPQVKKKKGA
jgi:hypothetical protein